MKKAISFTMKDGYGGGYVKGFHVWTPENPPMWLHDYGIVAEAYDQNRLRWMLGILARMNNGNKYNLFIDITIMWNAERKAYQIWTYNRNWKGRESYYAGMIHAYTVMHPMKKKRVAVR
jgi:hypothetical protein